MAASNQGDCARLLSGNEPGSIPGLPASMGCRPAARTPVSKTGNVGATPATLANSCREPASAGACLQNRRSGCDPLAALQFDGGRGELVNTARCDRVMTGSIPVDHPSPVSTMAVRPPCKRSTRDPLEREICGVNRPYYRQKSCRQPPSIHDRLPAENAQSLRSLWRIYG